MMLAKHAYVALAIAGLSAPVMAMPYGAAFESGSSSASTLDEVANSATAVLPARQTPAQTVASCGQGFAGVVTVPRELKPWRAPDPSPGTARGWVVRYEYTIGDNTFYEYESVVKVAPRTQDRGQYGGIMIVAADDKGATIINERGQPNYTSFYRKRTKSNSQFGQPVFKGSLSQVHEYRNFFGENPPAFTGDVYIGYGLISSKARQESQRRSNATQTMLPAIQASLDRELANARQYPDAARQSLQKSCVTQTATPTGRTSYVGDAGSLNESNTQALRELCASSGADNKAMRRVCELAASRASGTSSSTGDIASRMEQRRAEIAAKGGTTAGERKLDAEMQGICAAGDIEGLYARKGREARDSAEDMETMARAGFWEARAAYEDGSAKGTCWRVLQW